MVLQYLRAYCDVSANLQVTSFIGAIYSPLDLASPLHGITRAASGGSVSVLFQMETEKAAS